MNEEIKLTDHLTDEETRLLFGWGENIFGVLPHSLAWRPKTLHFLWYANEKPLSHAGILKHIIKVDELPVTVGGVGGVVTLPEAQRQGLAQRLMVSVADFLEREWRVEAGLLFCLPKMEACYARLGWQTIDAPVLIEQPSGNIESPLPVMVLPIGNKVWPKGNVHLLSLPW